MKLKKTVAWIGVVAPVVVAFGWLWLSCPQAALVLTVACVFFASLFYVVKDL